MPVSPVGTVYDLLEVIAHQMDQVFFSFFLLINPLFMWNSLKNLLSEIQIYFNLMYGHEIVYIHKNFFSKMFRKTCLYTLYLQLLKKL